MWKDWLRDVGSCWTTWISSSTCFIRSFGIFTSSSDSGATRPWLPRAMQVAQARKDSSMRECTIGRLAAVAASLIAAPSPTLPAQYFGQNKLQYRNFSFQSIQTEQFDIYY